MERLPDPPLTPPEEPECPDCGSILAICNKYEARCDEDGCDFHSEASFDADDVWPGDWS